MVSIFLNIFILGNLNLSRALGDLEYKRDNRLRATEQLIIAVPDVKKTELDYTTDKYLIFIYHLRFILMGCDGVFETLDHAALLDHINKKIK